MADINNAFTKQDYEIIERDVLFQGKILRIARYQLRFRLFDGEWSKVISREVMERGKAAGILPYDPKTDKVLLIEQFRAGALDDPKNPWLLEVIAGILDTEEKPSELAIREAKEEANCQIIDVLPIYDFFVSPGGTSEQFALFVGRMKSGDADGVYGLKEEDENIRTLTLPSAQAFSLLDSGKIKTAPAIMALQWLRLHREKLRAAWT